MGCPRKELERQHAFLKTVHCALSVRYGADSPPLNKLDIYLPYATSSAIF